MLNPQFLELGYDKLGGLTPAGRDGLQEAGKQQGGFVDLRPQLVMLQEHVCSGHNNLVTVCCVTERFAGPYRGQDPTYLFIEVTASKRICQHGCRKGKEELKKLHSFLMNLTTIPCTSWKCQDSSHSVWYELLFAKRKQINDICFQIQRSEFGKC